MPPERIAYPENVDCFVPLSKDRSTYRKCFVENSTRLFLPGPSSLEVVSKLSDDERTKTGTIDSIESLLQQLAVISQGQEQQVFYLIPQQHSWGRFRVSQEAFESILSTHQVCTPFLTVLEGFGLRVKEADHIDSCYYRHTCPSSDTEHRLYHYGPSTPATGDELTTSNAGAEVCFKVHFFERNNRDRGDPWSLRQTGIYQKFSSLTVKTTWILLQLSQRCRAVLEDKLENTSVSKQHPLLMHIVILSSLATDWTAYLQHLYTQLGDLDEKATFSRVPQRRKHDYDISFTDCQQLHLLQQKILRASVILDHCLQISTCFEKHCLELDQFFPRSQTEQLLGEIEIYSRHIKTYIKSIENLLQRSQGTAVLLSKILESRNETALQEINQTMQSNLSLIQRSASDTLRENSTVADMARQGQKDSRKLQALTLIATLYLPATLVATVFSSNLIQWKNVEDPTGRERAHYVVVSEFWIYIVCAVVLMIFTLIMARLTERGRWSFGI